MVGQQVLNRRVLPGGVVPADAVYVGRPSVWGNPFAIGRDGSRAQVIARYRVWLWQQLGRDPEFLAPLRGRRLVAGARRSRATRCAGPGTGLAVWRVAGKGRGDSQTRHGKYWGGQDRLSRPPLWLPGDRLSVPQAGLPACGTAIERCRTTAANQGIYR